MNEKPLNCWEYKNCGREPGGSNVTELGVCPAAIEESFDGVNRGENAGRICWFLSRTLCAGIVQGDFESKHKSCFKCPFFDKVRTEEGFRFVFTMRGGVTVQK